MRSPRSTDPGAIVARSSSYNEQSDQSQLNTSRYLRGPESGRSLPLYEAVAVLRSTKQAARFWSKVTKLNGEDACWVWTSSRNQQGYGQFYVGRCKRAFAAHRLSFALAGADIADGMCVCHRCDNPICVRPDHLFLATHAENLRDMVRKGRHPETVLRTRGAA